MGIKFSVNEKYFDKWSHEMAYVLGYLYADGNLLHDQFSRGRYVSVTSIDEGMINTVKRLLNSEHTIVIGPAHDNNKSRFTLRMGNAALFNSLIKRGLYPNKSLTVRMPEIPDKFIRDFVRGYFDGDGCVYLYRSKGITADLIVRKLSIIFTSGSVKFLEDLLELLRYNLDLKQSKVYKGHRSFQLRFATSDTVKIFKFIYHGSGGLFLDRKLEIFKKYFQLRPVRVDNGISSILRLRGIGHVVK